MYEYAKYHGSTLRHVVLWLFVVIHKEAYEVACGCVKKGIGSFR